MKPTRLFIGIALVAVGLFGAYWAVCAQDRGPFFAPPPVLATDSVEKKAPLNFPHQTKPLRDKSKAADPSMIIPAEVYEVPRPVRGEATEPKSGVLGVVQVEGNSSLPLPMAPDLPKLEPKIDKGPSIPPPLPGLETKPLEPPMPVLEPTKALIIEPAVKEPAPKKLPLPEMPLPAVVKESAPKKVALPESPLPTVPVSGPLVISEATPAPPRINLSSVTEPILPPPAVGLQEVKPAPPKIILPSVTEPVLPPPAVSLQEVKPAPPKIILPSVTEPVLPPPAAAPPVVSVPRAAPPTIIMPAAALPEPEKPRAFVRIKPEVPETTTPVAKPAPDAYLVELQKRLADEKPFAPPSPIAPTGAVQAGMANLQTPSVTAEKRGLRTLRAQEAQTYQIVVRNLGPTAAQQVRIEDELPPNVKLISAEPMPVMQGGKATWFLSSVGANQEQTLRFTLQANTDTELTGRLSAHLAATSQTTTTSLRPRHDAGAMTIQLSCPNQVAVGKAAVFEVRVVNTLSVPLTGLVLYGNLPEGLAMQVKDELGTRDEREIKGDVDETIAPGESKTLKMPATAMKPGRWTVAVKLTANGGAEASATAVIDVSGQSLHLQQAPATRLYMGRDGDLRIELTNHTDKPLRNVAVADRLPDGLEFVAASERGLYQANSRTVYWLIDQLPTGKTQTLVVRVNGAKSGQHQNVVFAKADGVPETQSAGVVALEGVADLTLRVVDRDPLIELGKENVYEIRVHNPGNAPASNVRLQVQFPAGLMPKSAQGAKFSMDAQSVAFEPIASLEPNGQVTFRVSAVAQSMGDQRVRFAVQSEQLRTPIQREISTRVVER